MRPVDLFLSLCPAGAGVFAPIETIDKKGGR